MANVKKKTYDDTFLFSLPGEMLKHHNHITDFMVKSDRIENKRADNFRGVIEDIRRYQKSSIIYHILMRDDVIICLNEVEMPPAFKVFLAKDPKSNGSKRLFIDASGIIEFKNGSYICKNVQRLITYLFEAITWLLYEYEPEALLNNSNITLSATDCFMKLFDYIVGYFRFNGFSENRNKIDYLAALYFMVTVLGKDDDQYTHQVAAKLAGIEQSLTKSFSLYYEKEDLANINSFITLLADVFKLKGLNTEVFISRWIANCGTGTQFAPELFPSFTNMMIAAYVGAYIVNQKSIEKQCSSSMVKLCDNILRLGSIQLDRGKIFESYMNNDPIEEEVIPGLLTKDLKTMLEARKVIPDEVKFSKDDVKDRKSTSARLKAMVKYYSATEQYDKLSDKLIAFARVAIKAMSTTKNKEEYGIGVLPLIAEIAKKYVRKKRELTTDINEAINQQRHYLEQYRLSDKSLSTVIAKQLEDLMKAKNTL